MAETRFDHQRLDGYRLSIDFVECSFERRMRKCRTITSRSTVRLRRTEHEHGALRARRVAGALWAKGCTCSPRQAAMSSGSGRVRTGNRTRAPSRSIRDSARARHRIEAKLSETRFDHQGLAVYRREIGNVTCDSSRVPMRIARARRRRPRRALPNRLRRPFPSSIRLGLEILAPFLER